MENNTILNSDLEQKSPLRQIDTSFRNYLNRRKSSARLHLLNGIPDYAYALDYELREKILQIPHFYELSKKICATYANREMQMINQDALAVGPDQFPKIYDMGKDCAHRLGIGIPNIYVRSSTEMNAYTIAADDTSPLIVLFSGIVERMTPGELKAVIGHECGHIHNQHLVYDMVIQTLMNAGQASRYSLFFTAANIALMNSWSRAAEVTADRAALICADTVEDAISVNKKLLYGAAFGEYQVNIEPLRKQLEQMMKNPTKIAEIFDSHPGAARRIIAGDEFSECEVFYQWRPEQKKPGQVMRTKQETDKRCEQLIHIFQNK